MPGGGLAAIRSSSARSLRSAPSSPWKRSTLKRRFGRSNPRMSTTGSRRPSRATISSRTGGAAVAVSASTGGGAGGSAPAPRGRAAERLDRRAEAQVVGPEVVSPFRDAVRLVDHHERDLGHGELVDDLRLGE